MLDAVADRLLAIEDRSLVSYTGGWADYVRAQETEAALPPPPPKPKRDRERPKRPSKPPPSALELVEGEVERAEARVAQLEEQLASDWGDVELVNAHRAAREDLEALLRRWEALFAEVSDTTVS